MKRKRRVRIRVRGTSERPRLSVFRSRRNIQAQLVDDVSNRTLLGVSSLNAEIRGQFNNGGNIKAAELVGQFLARKAGESGFKKVVFDRSGYDYHGRIKALAAKAREGGLEF